MAPQAYSRYVQCTSEIGGISKYIGRMLYSMCHGLMPKCLALEVETVLENITITHTVCRRGCIIVRYVFKNYLHRYILTCWVTNTVHMFTCLSNEAKEIWLNENKLRGLTLLEDDHRCVSNLIKSHAITVSHLFGHWGDLSTTVTQCHNPCSNHYATDTQHRVTFNANKYSIYINKGPRSGALGLLVFLTFPNCYSWTPSCRFRLLVCIKISS